MTFGRASSGAVLGKPMSLMFPLYLDEGETLEPGCVGAEVKVGERSVPARDLRLQVERGEAANELEVHVQTIAAIEEPLLTITLAAGCPTKLRRRFVVFADPASLIAQADSASAPRAVRSRVPPVPTLIERAATAEDALKLRPVPGGDAAAPKARPLMSPATGSAAPPASAGAGGGAAAPLDPQTEANIARLRGDDAAEPENGGDAAPTAWRPWIAFALAVLLAWVGWRVWRRREFAVEPQTQPPFDEADAEVVSDPMPNTTAHAVLSMTVPAPPPVPPSRPAADTGVMSMFDESQPAALARSGPMSIDEQIDLEQQAEFFIVLGQHEEATDLLLSHLRRSGGNSPMPYLKLLEIHRQRGEREAYERARMRFNQRFGDLAPEWDVGPQAGRTLADYPQRIERLQLAWPTPADAMAELEAWLSGPLHDAEPFDLPAYQDALFLYQLARDLHRHPEAAPLAHSVDVVLPLAEDADGTMQTVRVQEVDLPLDDLDLPTGRSSVVIEHAVPGRLDLDLSEAALGAPGYPPTR